MLRQCNAKGLHLASQVAKDVWGCLYSSLPPLCVFSLYLALRDARCACRVA